jgi:hypothetical protein
MYFVRFPELTSQMRLSGVTLCWRCITFSVRYELYCYINLKLQMINAVYMQAYICMQ